MGLHHLYTGIHKPVYIYLHSACNGLQELSICLLLLAALTALLHVYDVENLNTYGQGFLRAKDQLRTWVQLLFHSSIYPLQTTIYLKSH